MGMCIYNGVIDYFKISMRSELILEKWIMEKVVLPYNHDQIINDFNEDDYYKYLNSNHILGGSLSDIITYQRRYFSHLSDDRNQTGAGLWSFITGLAKKSLPFVSKYILPEALSFTSNVLNETNNTKTKIDKNKLKSLGKTSLKNIASKVLSNSLVGKSGVRVYKLKSKNKKI